MKQRTRKLRRTTYIAHAFLCILVGLGLARRVSAGALDIALVGALLVVTIRKGTTLRVVLLGFTCVLIGVWRGSVFINSLKDYTRLSKTPVIIRAVVDSDGVYAEKSQLSFDVTSVRLEDPYSKALIGKIAVKGFGEPMVYKGDMVQVEGKLFPTRGSRQASIGFAQIKVLRRSNSTLNDIRRKFAAGMTSALPEPLGSFGLGLLIGQRTTLPKNLTDQLSAVGLTHIVAVSGYNLTIIILVAQRMTQKRSKYQATMISLGLIALFLLLTGSSASIVRAAIVSVLSLAAWYYGRRIKPHVLILLAAAATAFWNPTYLWSDLGWWLSFLAFTGVLIVGPLITKRFYASKRPSILMQILLETIAAQVMTIPLIMYVFGKFSVVSLLANMLVVPLVPIAMLLCLIAGLTGMLIAPLAGWFAWPARLLMTYMVDIVQMFSRLPHAVVARSLRFDQMMTLYSVLAGLLIIWWKKLPKERKITDRKRENTTGEL